MVISWSTNWGDCQLKPTIQIKANVGFWGEGKTKMPGDSDSEPDYIVSFSPGWNFALPTGLKYFCDYMFNFSPGAKRKFPWGISLRCENTVDAHARVPFSARDEKMIAITWIFQPVWILLEWILQNMVRYFVTHKQVQTYKEHPIYGPITWWVSPRAEISARLTGLKFQTGFWNKSSENQVVDYMERDSARAENPSPVFSNRARIFNPAKRAEKSM